MSKRSIAILALGLTTLFLVILIGCSSDSGTTSSGSLGGDITYYFPVTEGYKTVYDVTYASGSSQTVSFEIGRQVSFGYSAAYEWKITEGDTRQTSYVVVTDTSVVFYENTRLPGETILSLPLSTGQTWNRFSPVEQDTTTVMTYYNDFWNDKLGGDDPSTDDFDGINEGRIYQKNFPTTGSNEMEVDGVESLSLAAGQVYSGAVRLKNGGSGKDNYYWFAPGIGLVKYVIGAGDDISTGEVVGTLISYGQ